jgi:hypothetical protein
MFNFFLFKMVKNPFEPFYLGNLFPPYPKKDIVNLPNSTRHLYNRCTPIHPT